MDFLKFLLVFIVMFYSIFLIIVFIDYFRYIKKAVKIKGDMYGEVLKNFTIDEINNFDKTKIRWVPIPIKKSFRNSIFTYVYFDRAFFKYPDYAYYSFSVNWIAIAMTITTILVALIFVSSFDFVIASTLIIMWIVAIVIKFFFSKSVKKYNVEKKKYFEMFGLDLMYYNYQYMTEMNNNVYKKNRELKKYLRSDDKIIFTTTKVIFTRKSIIIPESKLQVKLFDFNHINKLAYSYDSNSFLIVLESGERHTINDFFVYFTDDLERFEKYILLIIRIFEINNEDTNEWLIDVLYDLFVSRKQEVVLSDYIDKVSHEKLQYDNIIHVDV